MFSSLALAALLTMSPAQLGGTLTLTNARSNYGELGTTRPDNKLLPGDIFFLGFDIEAIKVDEEGSVSYTMSMEVVDKAGKSIFKQKPENKKDFLPLGGNKLPARAFVSIGLDQAPGIYTCKVIVEDRAAKTTATMEKTFEVVAPGFGLVQVYTSCDDRGALPAPQVGIVGQSVWVQFALVGFERGKDPSQPDLTVEMAALDANGKATLAKPTVYTINKDVPLEDKGIPLRFLLPMNRAGEYVVELKAMDNRTKKTSRVVLPFKVITISN